jgi:hypothetical protein
MANLTPKFFAGMRNVSIGEIITKEIQGISLLTLATGLGVLWNQVRNLAEWRKEHEEDSATKSDLQAIRESIESINRRFQRFEDRFDQFDSRFEDKLRENKVDLRQELLRMLGVRTAGADWEISAEENFMNSNILDIASEISSEIRNGGNLKTSKKERLQNALDDNNLSVEDVAMNLRQLAFAEKDEVRLRANETALKLHGVLTDEKATAPVINIVIPGEAAQVNAIFFPRT